MPSSTRKARFAVVRCIALAIAGYLPLCGQSFSEVRTIYVASLGDTEGGALIREKIISRLARSKLVTLVTDADQADAIMTGVASLEQGHRWVAGRSGGSGGSNWDATVAVRLVNKDKRIVWAAEAKQGVWSRSASSSAADKICKMLSKDIEKARKTK